MDANWNFASSFFLSLLLHAVLIVLLVFSVDTSVRKTPKVMPQVNIVKAVSVDKNQVEKELNRFKEIEKEKVAKELNKQQKLERKLRDLEKLAEKAKKTRKAEEKKLAEVKKKKTVEQKKREEEQNKLSQLKKEKAEIEKKQKEDDERKHKEEAERKKRDEIKQKEEQERQRKHEEEQRLQQELAEEQLQLEAEQLSRDQQLLQNIIANIRRRIISNFNISGLPEGLEGKLLVQVIPGGEVISVTISKSSGNDLFDRRALLAVQKSSPLPIPEDVATFERLGLRRLLIPFQP